ncbi:MAG: zinc-ribbon domain-containing protein [Clostridiales bacterium]|jgi:MFS family permease|nr:zinc-ribbon domain-containing protein [Clostridiales bacterium]
MYCSNCGAQIPEGAQFCTNCGVRPAEIQSAPTLEAAAPAPSGYEGSYAENIHKFGGSNLFLIGIAMFSGATVLNALATFSFAGIFGMAIAALPIIAMWLIFAASKQPKLPEKTFPALTLVKVYTIIGIVVTSLVIVLTFIGGLILTFAGNFDGWGLLLIIGGLAMIFGVGLAVLFLIFYLIALLRAVKGIEEGLRTDIFKPLRGVKSFIVIAWIIIGFSALGAMMNFFTADFAQGSLDNLFWEIPELRGVFDDIMPGAAALRFTSFFTLVSLAGQGILLVILSRFNTSLTERF